MKWLNWITKGYRWLASHKRTFFIVFLILVVLITVAIIHNKNKPKTPSTAKPSYLHSDINQLATADIDSAKTSVARKDYDSAANYCDIAVIRYYYREDYTKAESTLVDCMSLIPKDKIQWFLYKDLGAIELALGNKTGAKKSFSTALEKYKASTDRSQSLIDDLNDRISKAEQ